MHGWDGMGWDGMRRSYKGGDRTLRCSVDDVSPWESEQLNWNFEFRLFFALVGL